MKIIVGLGNPGKEYALTRHNAGFMLVDKLAKDGEFKYDKKFEADICKVDNLMLVKPQTFMNESGRSVRKVLDYFGLSNDDLVLIHDDLDLGLGDFKVQRGVGPKVHNGVSSIEKYLGTGDFWRARLGVDNRSGLGYEVSGADFVLQKMSKEEQENLDEGIRKAIKEMIWIFD